VAAYFVGVFGVELAEANAGEGDDGEVGAGRVEVGECSVVVLERVVQPAVLDARLAMWQRSHLPVIHEADERRRTGAQEDGTRNPVHADHQVQYELHVPD